MRTPSTHFVDSCLTIAFLPLPLWIWTAAAPALLPILDSECTRQGAASDAALVATYNRSFQDRPHYGVCGPATTWRKRASGGTDEFGMGILGLNGGALVPTAATAGPTSGSHFTRETDFVVVHYAGPVIYSSDGFVEKNRDALFDHVATLMGTSSSNALVRTWSFTWCPSPTCLRLSAPSQCS